MRAKMIKRANLMKTKKKVIENVRIRKDRAEALKEKSFEISMKLGTIVTEADLVNYLIDNHLENVKLKGEVLILEGSN
jgi:hypothetical protein